MKTTPEERKQWKAIANMFPPDGDTLNVPAYVFNAVLADLDELLEVVRGERDWWLQELKAQPGMIYKMACERRLGVLSKAMEGQG